MILLCDIKYNRSKKDINLAKGYLRMKVMFFFVKKTLFSFFYFFIFICYHCKYEQTFNLYCKNKSCCSFLFCFVLFIFISIFFLLFDSTKQYKLIYKHYRQRTYRQFKRPETFKKYIYYKRKKIVSNFIEKNKQLIININIYYIMNKDFPLYVVHLCII